MCSAITIAFVTSCLLCVLSDFKMEEKIQKLSEVNMSSKTVKLIFTKTVKSIYAKMVLKSLKK
jgi:hypothetical protein